MEKRVDIFRLMYNEKKLQTALVYPSQETQKDPYEKNKTISYLNPIPIKALIMNVSPEAIAWKYYGQLPTGSKQLICEKKYLGLFKIADKIVINNEEYKTYKDDQKGFQLLERDDYLVIVLRKVM